MSYRKYLDELGIRFEGRAQEIILGRTSTKVNQVSDLTIDMVKSFILYDDTCLVVRHVSRG